MPIGHRDELEFNTLTKDGEYTAYLYRFHVIDADTDYSFPHGLNHAPIKIQIVDSSEQIEYPKVVQKDEEQVILNFNRGSVDVTVRFE